MGAEVGADEPPLVLLLCGRSEAERARGVVQAKEAALDAMNSERQRHAEALREAERRAASLDGEARCVAPPELAERSSALAMPLRHSPCSPRAVWPCKAHPEVGCSPRVLAAHAHSRCTACPPSSARCVRGYRRRRRRRGPPMSSRRRCASSAASTSESARRCRRTLSCATTSTASCARRSPSRRSASPRRGSSASGGGVESQPQMAPGGRWGRAWSCGLWVPDG